MRHSNYIRAIAIFLLTVFSLNTVVGFACSVGVNLGFNAIMPCADSHAAKKHSTKSHDHKANSKDHHAANKHASKSHDHASKSKDHHAVKKESCGKKKNCCKDKVKQFQQLDKQTSSNVSVKATIQFSQIIHTYTIFNISAPRNSVIKDVKPFVRSYHPPITDIRIQIQSFQI